jgi:hypothetical protein
MRKRADMAEKVVRLVGASRSTAPSSTATMLRGVTPATGFYPKRNALAAESRATTSTMRLCGAIRRMSATAARLLPRCRELGVVGARILRLGRVLPPLSGRRRRRARARRGPGSAPRRGEDANRPPGRVAAPRIRAVRIKVFTPRSATRTAGPGTMLSPISLRWPGAAGRQRVNGPIGEGASLDHSIFCPLSCRGWLALANRRWAPRGNLWQQSTRCCQGMNFHVTPCNAKIGCTARNARKSKG